MALTIEQFRTKLKKWAKKYPGVLQKGFKDITADIKRAAEQEYLSKLNRTGESAKSMEIEIGRGNKISFSVFFGKKFDRRFIAKFHEFGTRKMKATPIWSPLRKRYKLKVMMFVLAKIMDAYRGINV